MKLTTYLTAAFTTATLLLSNKAAAGSIETMAGDKSATIDLKVAANVAPRTNFFTRSRTTIDYENEVSYFGLTDLSVNLVDGLDVVAEAQFIPGSEIIPRAGMQYFISKGDASLYALASVGLSGKPDGEFQQILTYKQKVTGEVSLTFSAENITNVAAQGHAFSLQRLRAGVVLGKYE